MPKQFEHDVSASVAGLKAALGINGGQFGGGRIDNFRKGWAMHIWGRGHKRVHYWLRRDLRFVVSNCGLIKSALWETPSGDCHSTLHGGGDFPRCKRCERLT